MKTATVTLSLDLDPLTDDKNKMEFDLRVALCLLAHEDCNVQVESAPITAVRIEEMKWQE